MITNLRSLALLGILLLGPLGSSAAHSQTADAGVPTASETEKGTFVRQLLSSRQLRVDSCRFARAECERLMNEFVRGKDVDFFEPALRSQSGQDAAFRELISPCLPPPQKGFFDTHAFYRASMKQVGGGNAVGPFTAYRIPELTDAAHQSTALIRMEGFRFSSGDPESYYWVKYARLDPTNCGTDSDEGWLFAFDGDTRSRPKLYFADGVMRLGDEYYLYEFQQGAVTHADSYDAAAGVLYVRMWKLQADIRAMSILGFHAE